ncbi:hypothetical protein RF11_12824 [Thelohanellus kitauei]|uniref:DUF4371 domain-containing protein n=1 Tax=Thelohanellus kitauei TaxID=669202 RepID=A0A0C2MAP3_THEKT|nr:hypothetical protein RF11_12824 [Thelohanellus kitauei]
MIGDEYVNKLNGMYTSLDTVDRRIADISADILDQMIQEMKSSTLPIFSILLDESTDVENGRKLLVYARYIHDSVFKRNFPEISQEEFIEHLNSDVAKTNCSPISISQFMIKCLKFNSVISEPFLRLLLPFPPTFHCETAFSGLLFINYKYSIRLDAEDDIRRDIGQTMPRNPDLVKQKQDQSSQ